jgi:hypothetical protein
MTVDQPLEIREELRQMLVGIHGFPSRLMKCFAAPPKCMLAALN